MVIIKMHLYNLFYYNNGKLKSALAGIHFSPKYKTFDKIL